MLGIALLPFAALLLTVGPAPKPTNPWTKCSLDLSVETAWDLSLKTMGPLYEPSKERGPGGWLLKLNELRTEGVKRFGYYTLDVDALSAVIVRNMYTLHAHGPSAFLGKPNPSLMLLFPRPGGKPHSVRRILPRPEEGKLYLNLSLPADVPPGSVNEDLAMAFEQLGRMVMFDIDRVFARMPVNVRGAWLKVQPFEYKSKLYYLVIETPDDPSKPVKK